MERFLLLENRELTGNIFLRTERLSFRLFCDQVIYRVSLEKILMSGFLRKPQPLYLLDRAELLDFVETYCFIFFRNYTFTFFDCQFYIRVKWRTFSSYVIIAQTLIWSLVMAIDRTRHFNTFVTLDIESTGLVENGWYPQIQDLAFVRTDSDLNIIEERNILVKPRLDINPHPMATAVTRINIDMLERKGKPELDAITEFQNYLLEQPGTATIGYNSGRFDNEVIRHTLYRNLKNPYQHEWSNGNGHIDLYPLIQMVYAYSPGILEWPLKDDGSASFKLEHLTSANGIVHEQAHDALSDVKATIQLAKLVKERNPKIWNHALWLSDKKNAASLVTENEVLFQTSTFFGKDCRMTRPVAPIIPDIKNANQRYCIDLSCNPEDLKLLCQMSPDDVKYYKLRKREDLPEGSPIIPITKFQTNKSPNIIQANRAAIINRANDFGYNAENVRENLAIVNENRATLKRIIQEAMTPDFPASLDPYQGMYEGFPSKRDEKVLQDLHSRDSVNPEKTMLTEMPIKDIVQPIMDKKKYGPMILRAKYYNYLEDVMFRDKAPIAELRRFYTDLINRTVKGDNGSFTFKDFHAELNRIRKDMVLDEQQEEALGILEKYMIKKEKEVLPEIQREIKNLSAEQAKFEP